MTRDGLASPKREQKRSRVFLKAEICVDGCEMEVRMRDLSILGALLESDEPPAAGTDLLFRRGETETKARVAWVEGHRFGIAFDKPMDDGEVAAHIGSPLRVSAPRTYSGPDMDAKSGAWTDLNISSSGPEETSH